MQRCLKTLAAAGLVLGLGMGVAGAEVVCNEDGDCWRTRERYEYKPELRLQVYPNDWRWEERDNDRYRWREAPNQERGYWRSGVWVEIND